MSASPLKTSSVLYSSQNEQLYIHGKSVADNTDQSYLLKIKGASWFGLQGDGAVHGLWAVTLDSLLDFLQANKFNALRLPLSVELCLNMSTFVPASGVINYSVNPNLQGLKSMEICDLVVQGCAKRGILVLFDFHTLKASNTNIDSLWYDATFSEAKVIQAWKNVAERYASAWNVLGYDLKNEPHGSASWGDGVQATDWRLAAQRLGDAILQTNFRGLIFVEGVETNAVGQNNLPHWWGGNLEAADNFPVQLQTSPLKLVYSPHVYGPDVFMQSYFSPAEFPNNMPLIWEQQWAKLTTKNLSQSAVVIGEWGGKFLERSLDRVWHMALATYLLDNIKLTNNFYWCLNPNSGDTNGLLGTDWKTPDTAKLELLDIVQQTSTRLLQDVGDPTRITLPNATPVTSGVVIPVPAVTPPPPPPPSGNLTADEALTLFKDLYAKLHDPANGYYSDRGIPFHTNKKEPVICEAPESGLQSTSESVGFAIWLEVANARLTGDWSKVKDIWDVMEQYFIPNSPLPNYNSSNPAQYAPEHELPSAYPATLNPSVKVGQDPIWNELQSKHGNRVYNMHWLVDVVNSAGFLGPTSKEPAYVNTFQRGSEESVWETIVHPSIDKFEYGKAGEGFVTLFVKDSGTPAKQARWTLASDADCRAINAIYDALQFATQQGGSTLVNDLVKRAAKMGDWLRTSMFDKYFKPLGCQTPSGPGGVSRQSCHYLMSWYSAWGFGLDNSWSWRIGSSHVHHGYQSLLTAYAMSTVPEFTQNTASTGPSDWSTSLKRQIQLLYWLQSSEGAIAGGITNSYKGRYEAYPANVPTFYSMMFETNPVYLDPGSNTWAGFQYWNLQRVSAYLLASKDTTVLPLLTRWVNWAVSTVQSVEGHLLIPSTLHWSGQPDASYAGESQLPAANSGLHVQIMDYGNDLGLKAALARILLQYSASGLAGDTTREKNLGVALLQDILSYKDEMGYSSSEKRPDYSRFTDKVFVPSGYVGKMPSGASIDQNSTFISLRPHIAKEPAYQQIAADIASGKVPELKYHRFWTESEIAISLFTYALLFGNIPVPPISNPPPPNPVPGTGLTHQVTKVGNPWPAPSGPDYAQYNVVTTNSSSQTISAAETSIKVTCFAIRPDGGYWNVTPKSVTASPYVFGFPAWITTLSPAASFSWGFICQGEPIIG